MDVAGFAAQIEDMIRVRGCNAVVRNAKSKQHCAGIALDIQRVGEDPQAQQRFIMTNTNFQDLAAGGLHNLFECGVGKLKGRQGKLFHWIPIRGIENDMLRGKEKETSIMARENSHFQIVARPLESFQNRSSGGIEENCVQAVRASVVRIVALLKSSGRLFGDKCGGHGAVAYEIHRVERSQSTLPLECAIGGRES